jgi:hypothetical protein
MLGEFGGHDVFRELSARSPRPGAQADAGGGPVSDVAGGGVEPAADVHRLADVTEAVEREGDVPGGGVDLPPVPRPFEEADGFPAAGDALLVAGRAVEQHAVETE